VHDERIDRTSPRALHPIGYVFNQAGHHRCPSSLTIELTSVN
jgi:hypothetical protein